MTLTLIALLPAFAVLAIRAIVGQRFADRFPELIPYRQYLTEIGLTVTIFAAILCPELLCPDRRDNVLSLYLSTAVGRLTYVVGKVLAAVVPLLCLTLLPVLLLFVGNTFFAESATTYLARPLARPPAHHRLGPPAGVLRQPRRPRGRIVHEPAGVRARRLRGADADPDFVGGSLVYGADLDRHLQLIMLGRLPIAAARSLYPGGHGPGLRARRLVVVGGLRRRDGDLGRLPVVALPEGRRLTLVFAGVSKWYGDTVALAEVSFELAPGRDRPARPQRRRQVDGAGALRGLRRSEHRARCACSASTRGASPRSTGASASSTTATASGRSSPRASWSS